MNIIKKILIPYNFSETSLNALQYAVNFANNESDIELHLLHITAEDSVLDTKSIDQNFEDTLVLFKSQTESPISYEVVQGDLVSTIIKQKNKIDANMIIIGTSGSNDKGNTKTSALIKEVDCSVIVVPKSHNRKFKLSTIAVTLDKNRIDDNSVLNTLLDTTRRFGAQVHALTVLTDNSSHTEADESNENLLNYYLEHFYSHHSFPKGTDIEKSVFDYVKNHKIDMLCIVSRHHSQKKEPSEGKLVNAFAKHTKVPLLILD